VWTAHLSMPCVLHPAWSLCFCSGVVFLGEDFRGVNSGAFVSVRAASSSYYVPNSNSTHFVFSSFTSRLQVHDSTDAERRGLALRRTTKHLWPWTTENPLFLHAMNTTQGQMFAQFLKRRDYLMIALFFVHTRRSILV
jgi:hypothetical protein